ncbi:MAG TPA: HIT domain-containing protein [Candidatus Limnocylindria bacterium]|nr:HIT domain-containing protein [Candidatus Limnocylindria bacterium]
MAKTYFTGEVEIRRVFEDELVLAFHHSRPAAPLHVVIVPKKHTPSLRGPAALDPALSSR